MNINKKAVQCFRNQMARCNNPKNPRYKDNGAKGIVVEYSMESFVVWYVENIKNFDGKSPSVGRIDHSRGYSFNNIRFESLADNSMERISRAGTTKPMRSVHIVDFETQKIIKTVASLKAAEKETGICSVHISNYCKGRLNKTKGGLTFRFAGDTARGEVRAFVDRSKSRCRRVLIINAKTMLPILIASSLTQAASATGVNKSHIGKYCSGYLKMSSGGYTFRYLGPDEYAD